MKIIRAQRKRRKVRKIFMNKRIRKWLAAMVMMVCALVGSVMPAFAQVDPDWEETMAVEENLEETEETEIENAESDEENDKETGDDAEEEAAFSTPGNGELGDAITSGNKDFYTIHTKNNNTFYLVIDHSGSTDNVYMLSMIDENDLSEFMEDAAEVPEESQVVVVPEETQEVEPETEPEPEQEAEPEGNASLMTLLVLATIGVGGALYYFKVYKPKKEDDEYESEGMETEDGLETENEDEETE